MALKLKTPKSPTAEKMKGVAEGHVALLRETGAAKILNVSVAYLRRDRWYAKAEGVPPKVPFLKMPNGAVRYHPDDLKAVIDASRVGG